MENWQEIKESPGYWISDQGKVRGIRGTIIKTNLTNKGYEKLRIKVDGLKKTFLVHRLVLKAFGPEQPPDTTCDHINRIKTDNRIENLRWATKEQQHANTKSVQGSENSFHKLVEDDIPKIKKLLEQGVPQRQIGQTFNISQANISKIHRGVAWTHVQKK
jgi:YesN/AraC family two-component response regulator